MRRPLSFVAIILGVLCCVPGRAQAQTVDEIVAKNLKAKGGIEKLKAISSLKMSGTMTLQGNETPLQMWSKRPNLFRREIELQGQKIIQACDGNTVWMINPMMGSPRAQVIPAEQAKPMKEDADFDGVFVDYQSRGTKIELVGNEKLNGKDAYHLKVTPKGGDPQDYYLDASTGLETKVTRVVDQGGTKMSVETDLSDYREINGMMVPFSTQQSLNGTPIAKMTIQNVEFNVPIGDELFTMPVAK